jgi:hypothetical protein
MATKSAHWQAAFRRRMREAGLKALTLWMPKEGADRLARYPEKERGEIVTRALALLESQGESTGNDATLTGEITGESQGEEEGEAPEDTLTLAELFTRLERVEATLSTITSNSTGVLTGEASTLTGYFPRELTGDEPPGPPATLIGESTGELTGEAASEATSITGESTDKSTSNAQTAEAKGEAVTVTEAPSSPVAELTDTTQLVHPAKLPLKRVAALTRRAKKLHAQGVSWREIAHRFNAEDVPTLSGIGQWHGSTVQHMIEKHGRE